MTRRNSPPDRRSKDHNVGSAQRAKSFPDQSGAHHPNEDESTYEIGYGKPPLHTRFKKGRSGNPKGRPRRHRNLKTVLDEVLSETISVREGERKRSLPRIEVLVRTIVNRALGSDVKATQNLIVLLRTFTGPDINGAAPEAEIISAEDEALVADFLDQARNEGLAAPHRPKDGRKDGHE